MSRISDTDKYASSICLSRKGGTRNKSPDQEDIDNNIAASSHQGGISSYFSGYKSNNIHNQALFGSEKEVGEKLKNVLMKSETK